MRVSWMLLGAMIIGCESPPLEETTCVENLRIRSRGEPPKFDVLLIIDRSTAMAPYLEALDENLSGLGRGLEQPTDLHLASIAADLGAGGVRAADCSATDGDVVFDLFEPWWRCSDDDLTRCRVTNRTAPLGETMACMGRFGAGAIELPRPFDAMLRVVDPREPELEGFLRPDATFVALVIAAADDASEAGVGELVTALEARWPYPNSLIEIVAPAGATRLEALADRVRAPFDSIGEGRWSIGHFAARRGTRLDGRCVPELDPVDTDKSNPGLQPDVAFEVELRPDGGGGDRIRWCQMAAPSRPHPDTPLPCTWIEPDPHPIYECNAVVWLEAPRSQLVRGGLQYVVDCPEP